MGMDKYGRRKGRRTLYHHTDFIVLVHWGSRFGTLFDAEPGTGDGVRGGFVGCAEYVGLSIQFC